MFQTVSSVTHSSRGAWDTRQLRIMPTDQRRKSNDSFDAIDPDFPPPSLKQPENSRDREKPKKKDKKWSLGGFFRRKKKASDTESSSSIEDGEEKKGFLERRRAARKRRNRGSKDVTGSFEHVRIAPQNQQNVEINSDHPRFKELVEERLVGRSHESLAKRQQDHFMRGSSVSLEAAGKKGGRIQVKARVEANRGMLKVDSSSDEGGSSRHSTSSMQRSKCEDTGSKEGSLSRRSRAARTERYKKRLSRDEDHMKDFQTNSSSRISRSDERLTNKSKSHERVPSNSRWTAKVVYCESSDYETKYTAKTKSATPSPLQSPKVRPKNALHYTSSAPPSSNYVTFPPSHAREGVAGSYQELRSKNFPGGHPTQKVSQMYSDVTPPRLPKSSSELIANTPLSKPSQRNQEVLNRKSASYDCNVNHLHFRNKQGHPNDENVVVAGLQFPISRPIQKVEAKITHIGVSPPKTFSKHQNPPPPPPRDPHRRLVSTNGHQGEGSGRPMSYAFEDRNQKYPGFTDFGSSVSAFHRVPQSSQTDLQSDPQMNKHHRSSSDHHIPGKINSVKLSPPMARRSSSAQQDAILKPPHQHSDITGSSAPSTLAHNNQPQHYHYYTDQHPRSRKPIHIAYQNQKTAQELNDSQKPPVQQTSRARPSGVQNAADFWKQKDQETAKKVHLTEGSPKLVQRHLLNINSTNDRSRSNSPYNENGQVIQKTKLAPLSMPRGDSSGSLSNQSSPRDISSPRTPTNRTFSHNEIGIPVLDTADVPVREYRPLSMLEENTETSEREISPLKEKLNPPRPPERRDSKVNAVTNFEHFDVFSDNDLKDGRRKSNNLEDALNELEAIYKSLRLGEDAYLEKVSKEKAICENNRLDPSNWNDWVKSRGFESDSSFNYSRSSMESVDSIDSPIKRPGGSVPDKVTDDMAYRRLNKKDKPPSQEQEVVSQAGSFLLVSPTLSPPPFLKFPAPPPVKNEPDITLDDVVYRNIKHTNNALRVLDPQPLFGIPLGPITPAPNSDYLHVTPKETYRPTFKPRKTPDVVTDDLAFRNLRKDNNKEPLFSPEDTTLIDFPVLKKKRAVRSLSANLLSIIHKESIAVKNNNNLIYNNNSSHIDLEKSQSFTDVPDAVSNNNVALDGLKSYRKLNELKIQSGEDSDATPRASRHYSTGTSSPLITTSTETLTGSKVTLVPQESQQSSFYPKVPRTSSPRHSHASERRHTTDVVNPFFRKSDSPIRHVPVKIEPLKINLPFENKQTSFNARRSPTPDSHSFTHQSDKQRNQSERIYDQTESDLLAALAREAKEASEQLSKELNELNFDKNIKPIKKIEKEDNFAKELNPVKENLVTSSPLKPLPIGKIVPHKPVKLNTFNITDDNKLENKQTIVTDKPIEIEGSRSMTDLLKELTKSLDFDFGPPKGEDSDTTVISEMYGDVKKRDREELHDRIDTNEETSSEIRNLKTDQEETYFSSLERIPDESSSSPEVSVLQTESTNEEQDKSKQNVSFSLTLPEDDLSLLQSLTEFTSAENQDQSNSTSPFPLVLPEDQPTSNSPKRTSQIENSSGGDHTYDLTNDSSPQSKELDEGTVAKEISPEDSSSPKMRLEKDCKSPPVESRISRDSTQGCSLDCTPVADEGTKCDPAALLVVCMACAHQLAGLDFLTILGLILAMASIILFLII